MYENIIDLIQRNELEKALEEIKNIEENKWEKYNLSGLIYFYKNELEKAKTMYEKGLKIEPINSDLLYNYAHILISMGKEIEAWKYLMRIHEKDWTVYDILGDIEYKNRSKPSAIKFYKKAYELNKTEEMAKKLIEKRKEIKKEIHIAFFCLPGLETFIKPIAEEMAYEYEVNLIISENPEEIKKGVEWADIVWIEWANELAVYMSNNINILNEKRVICRIHRYEVYSDYMKQIDWNKIDKIITVSKNIKENIEKNYKNLNKKVEIINNGVNLEKFKYLKRKKGKKICYIGYLHMRKNPMNLLEIMNKIKEEGYEIEIAGEYQDKMLKEYMEYMIKEQRIEKNIKFKGWIKNIDEFLKDKNYIISTSIHESFGYGIAEAMSRGIKPLINNFEGAYDIWPKHLIYNTIDEAIKILKEDEYNSEYYREWIENNYCFEEKIYQINHLFDKVQKMEKIIKKRFGIDELISEMREISFYNFEDLNNYNFKDSYILMGKIEILSNELNLIEFIVKNKSNKQIIFNNILYKVKSKQIIFPDYIELSDKKNIIEKFIFEILSYNLKYESNNIAGFINDKDMIEDISKNYLAYSWERGIPGTQFMPILGFYKIIQRYKITSKYLKNNFKILEAASGFGYGASYLSKKCEYVYALDISQDNIDFGSNSYYNKNISWINGDVTKLPFEDNKFDLYNSLETFEHIPLDIIDDYFKQALRVLKEDGIMIISTPNVENRRGINNPFHIKEYTFLEFSNILNKYFEEVKYYSDVDYKYVEGIESNSTNMMAICFKKKNSI
ncbi:methyltransferase domain-containing protein [Oceanotoga sp. DSM 15011]|uniref:methyltransferase domain-containing protein n=1 Tax=Oceanotoga sp. DSM 15011 TaxID=2984951 RepID=UPI0021F49D0C|nr:methyltransferase domain-containing protein [Oceanotoga sp. DSM 15011]UYP00921.1 methyltransferase domain-containing protein [Oceanotoga sp. DSM 15011]